MMPSLTIIGITGASGAGKSRFTNLLLQQGNHSPGAVGIIHEDAYYRSRNDLSFQQRCQINFDHPDAFQHDLLIQHLKQLRNGQPVQVPQYDYGQHNRSSEHTQLSPPSILILEGILILHEAQLRDQIDLKIFVDAPLDICLARRLRRDTEERGRSVDSVLNQYVESVRPMYFRFIEPAKQYADLIVPGNGDTRNALTVVRSYLASLL